MNPAIGFILGGIGLTACAYVIWRAGRPVKTCIYPHCSATRSHCAATCPHWQQDNYGEPDEHARDENLGV